jgi:hypothetical protein
MVPEGFFSFVLYRAPLSEEIQLGKPLHRFVVRSFANRDRFAHHYCFVLLATARQGTIARRSPRSRSTSPPSITKRQDYCSF